MADLHNGDSEYISPGIHSSWDLGEAEHRNAKISKCHFLANGADRPGILSNRNPIRQNPGTISSIRPKVASTTFGRMERIVPGFFRIGIRFERIPGRSAQFAQKCHFEIFVFPCSVSPGNGVEESTWDRRYIHTYITYIHTYIHTYIFYSTGCGTHH